MGSFKGGNPAQTVVAIYISRALAEAGQRQGNFRSRFVAGPADARSKTVTVLTTFAISDDSQYPGRYASPQVSSEDLN